MGGWARTPIAFAIGCCLVDLASPAGAEPPPGPAGDGAAVAALHVPRFHKPLKGVKRRPRHEPPPPVSDWNPLAGPMQRLESRLHDVGIRFDLDVAFFYQHASDVVSGKDDFGTFAWNTTGDAKLFQVSGLGTSLLGWNLFGTAGLNYDPGDETLTGNTGSALGLNGAVYPDSAALDELYWKQTLFSERLLLLLGRVDMLYHFDVNPVANDAYTDFTAFGLENNLSIPFPLYGGFGGIVHAKPTDWLSVMLGVGDSSADEPFAPWKTVDDGSWWQILEIGLKLDVPGLGAGNLRLTPWHNHLDGEDGWGVGLNLDQKLGETGLSAFFRFGAGDEDVTPNELYVAGGFGFDAPFGRAKDMIGIGVAWSDPSRGFGVRSQTLLETFYRVHLTPSTSLTADLQVIFDPANNPSRSTVWVPGLRFVMAF